ncbi:Hypothetical_protein [Hexamita inflata]|uniref:Hypothetical_protein n=1 Tax=Hexamita inflata TaxID=28002 RepID=A0AA86N696_9EUKA|nr:Hypothetical protein HINF_LOCUS1258 [Hexamita inflata]
MAETDVVAEWQSKYIKIDELQKKCKEIDDLDMKRKEHPQKNSCLNPLTCLDILADLCFTLRNRQFLEILGVRAHSQDQCEHNQQQIVFQCLNRWKMLNL